MKTSEKVRLARKAKGMTQKELANCVGAAQATINKIESDSDTGIKNTSFELAVKIASALEVDVFTLFGDESIKNKSSNASDKEIDRMKILVFHSIDKYESNQIFLKQFDYNEQDPEEWKKFDEYRLYLSEFKKGILEKLIEVGFCTQEDIKEYRTYINKQANERTYTTKVVDLKEENDIYKTFERELLDEIVRNDMNRKNQTEPTKTQENTSQSTIEKNK